MKKSRVLGVLLAPALSAGIAAEPAEGLAEVAEERPAGQVTAGIRAGDGFTEGMGDAVVPLLWSRNTMLFLNPRASYGDNDEEEYNLGLGVRTLLDEHSLILGANVYYDHRATQFGNEFQQLGLGLECLSTWFDLRANAYIPDDDPQLAQAYESESVQQSQSSTTQWGTPFAAGNAIAQDYVVTRTTTITTTRMRFEQYEQAMGGFDAEVGVRLPLGRFDDRLEVRLYGGWYSFNRESGLEDVEGVRARLEVRALPALILDAEWYEDDELLGSDWLVGMRVSVPFDPVRLARGLNPFAGWRNGFRPATRPRSMGDRMMEMVIRDLHVRTELSDFEEVVSARTTTTSTEQSRRHETVELLGDVVFVDGDNQTGLEDGSFSHPFDTIAEGVAAANSPVYVFDAALPYLENVVLQDDVILWGAGTPVPGGGGHAFGGQVFPVIDGWNAGPAVTMANRTRVTGFQIFNTPVPASPPILAMGPNAGAIDISRAGVWVPDVTPVAVDNNSIIGTALGFGAIRNGDLQVALADNTLVGSETHGALVDARGASGFFDMDSARNLFIGSGLAGMSVLARNYDLALLTSRENLAVANAGDGLSVDMNETAVGVVSFQGDVAMANGGHGFSVNHEGGMASILLISDSTAIGNGTAGPSSGFRASLRNTINIGIVGTPAPLIALAQDVIGGLGSMPLGLPEAFDPERLPTGGPVTAIGNSLHGIDLDLDGELASAALIFDTIAIGNGTAAPGHGINVRAVASNGLAAVAMLSGRSMQAIVDAVEGGGDALLGSLPVAVPGTLPGTLPVFDDLGPIQASQNTASGVHLDVDGGLLGLAALVDVSAVGNGASGIDATVHSDGLLSAAAAVAVTAYGNAGPGVRLLATGDAIPVVLLLGSEASGNLGGPGFDLAADSSGGNAVAWLMNSRANGNAGDGVRVQLNANGDVTLAGTALQANGNAGSGFAASGIASNGSATAELSATLVESMLGLDPAALPLPPEIGGLLAQGPSEFSGNGIHGLQLNLESSTLDAATRLQGVVAANNASNGVHVLTTAGNEATFFGESIVSVFNGHNGLDFNIAGLTTTADLGGGPLGSAGLNSLFGNANRDARNASAFLLPLQSTWWGSPAGPGGGQVEGPVDTSNWLLADPNPGP